MTLTALALSCTLLSVTDGDTFRAACPEPVGIQFNAVFGQRWRDLPRDAQGRVLRGGMEGGE
jgi:hypothetical protein